MPSNVVITIQLKPYLIDWLRSRYGKYPLVATKTNMIGQLIKYFLERTPLDYVPLKNSISSCDILLPYDYYINVRGSVYVPPRENKILEKIIEEIFNDMYFSFVTNNYLPRTQRNSLFENGVKDLTERFMEINRLNPDHISHETLIKRYQRYRKKAIH
jgi:hypothetical protein